MKGLGKQQLKLRNKTDHSLLTTLKKERIFMTVNEIIRKTKKDPTAVIKSINRLVADKKVLELRYKNKRLVFLNTEENRDNFTRIRADILREKRSKAQRDILIMKLAGKLPKNSILEKKLAKYEPDTDELFKNAVKSLDEGTIAHAFGFVEKEKVRLMIETHLDDPNWDKVWKRIDLLHKRSDILVKRMQRDDLIPI